MKSAAAVWDAEEQQTGEALSELLKYSLLQWDAASRRYVLHDLARLYANAQLSAAERVESQLRHATYYKDVLDATKVLYKEGGKAVLRGLGLYDMEQENIQAGQEWAASEAEKDDKAARLASGYPDAGVYVLNLRLHARQWIEWLKSGLAGARQLKDRAVEGIHLGNLGMVYSTLGETQKAIEFYEQALVIARDIGDRRNEGAWLGNLGIAHRYLVKTEKAIEFHEQALVISREIGDRRGEGNALGGMGLVYADLGETQKAIGFYEQWIEIASYIGDRFGEGQALGNLGVAFAALGETKKAVDFYEQQLEIVRETDYRRGEGNALGNMSMALEQLGQREEAIRRVQAALEIFEQ
ncbi:MAG: tetratricopeptide repeat protein, partial [Chloroflexi bacterium]|nr:tetratricopeptide repeat protein [Chloroflexota bacterium]